MNLSRIHFSLGHYATEKFFVFLLAVIALAHSGEAWQNHLLRQRIASGFAYWNPAKQVVIDNAGKGLALDHGWSPAAYLAEGVRVDISRNTGVIVVTFAGDDGVALGDLKLVPICVQGRADCSALVVKVFPNDEWLCLSRDSTFPQASGARVLGSLPSRYAPAECR
jgi:hypothetical protein